MADFITQIFIADKGYLDIDKDINVPLTFSVAEIQDISKRKGGFSKTITLPGTSANNEILGQLFDCNIVNSSFNVNAKAGCSIIQNGVTVFDGFMQLLEIKKESSGQGGVDDFIQYSVAVKDSTGDFFSSLDGAGYTGRTDVPAGMLNSLEFSGYNHTYNLANVMATSGNTYGYKYHMMYSMSDSYYTLQDFKPSLFALTYWDAIFKACGYSYTWSGLTETLFDKMIIPWNGEKALEDVSDITMQVGWNAPVNLAFPNSPAVQIGQYQHEIAGNQFSIGINDNSTSPNADPNGLFNMGTNTFTANYFGKNTMKFKYTYEVYLQNPVGSAITLREGIWSGQNAASSGITYSIYQEVWRNNTWLGYQMPTPVFQKKFNNGESLAPFSTTLIGQGLTNEMAVTFDVAPGQTFNPILLQKTLKFDAEWFRGSASGPSGAAAIVNPTLIIKIGVNPTDNQNNYFKNTPQNAALNEGRTLLMNNLIPKNIKWRDYISGVVKLFNLYMTPDPDNDTNIIIETRDEFYANGGVRDWTQKIDLNKPHSLKFLPDLQSKDIVFTYKKGGDPFNGQYFNATNEVFGQYNYTFDSEFNNTTKKIETIFESTPINETFAGGGNNLVSMIDSIAPKTGLRILFDGAYTGTTRWIPGYSWTYFTQTGATLTEGTTQVIDGSTTGYPYAGHLYPNPKTPTDDLNFGVPQYIFYDANSQYVEDGLFKTFYPETGLFNKYYQNYMNQIENGKLLTAYFKLTEVDIAQLNLRDKIFILDNYYVVNRIIDYNANTKDGLTKVELISIETTATVL